MAKTKKAPSLHVRPKKGESKEAFTKRLTDSMIAAEQAYRKKNGFPLLKDDRK
jgi:hypothetical protein